MKSPVAWAGRPGLSTSGPAAIDAADSRRSLPRKLKGSRPKLCAEQVERLKARLDAGPRPEDGVCTLRGKDIIRILEAEFGVKHSIGSIYKVLHRIGYSCLSPRPRHEHSDPTAIDAFKREAPFLSARSPTR